MKSIILLLVLAVSFQSLMAQDKISQVAEKTCECLKTKDFKNKTKEEITMELGLCMIAEATKLNVKLDFDEPNGMEKFGEKVGLKMAVICPESFMTYLSTETKDGSSLMQDYMKDEDAVQHMSGTLLKVTKEDIAYLFLVNSEGKQVKFMLFEYFANAEKLLENSKDFINHKVTVDFKESEYYLPRIGEFVKMKEVVAVSLD